MLKRSIALVAEYSAGTTAAELGHRYGIAKSSLLLLVRHAGQPVRHLRLSAAETARLVQLYEAGLPQKDIAQPAWQEPECSVALSAPVGESVNNARLPFWSSGD
jgi:hypothetical protein